MQLTNVQGCNVPNVDIVVQWKLPASVSIWAGRAGRGEGTSGLAVLLVEKSVYEADISQLESEGTGTKTKKKTGVQQSATYPKANKQYAIAHGLLRGAYGGAACDDNILNADVQLDCISPDKGLYTLVQTGGCRWQVLTAVYKSKTARMFSVLI